MRLRIVLLSGVALLAGCMSAPAPIPQDNFYRFAPLNALESLSAPSLRGSLFVELPRAAGLRRSRALLYSDDPERLRLRQYHYHHWEEPPARLLQRRLVEALGGAGIADSVAIDRRFNSDYLLRTELLRFDRLLAPESATALVEIQFRIAAGRRDEWLFERNYSQEVPADSLEMNDTIDAFSEAVDLAVRELVNDLQGFSDNAGFAVKP